MRPRPPRTRSRLGITVLELVIVVAVLGVLAAIAIPQYVGYQERARVKQAIAAIRTLEMEIDRYRTEFGRLPAQLAFAVDPVPRDPWGNPYQYLDIENGGPLVNGQRRKDKNLVPINSDYDLYSKGPDGGSHPPLTAQASRDDVVRASNGGYVGTAADY